MTTVTLRIPRPLIAPLLAALLAPLQAWAADPAPRITCVGDSITEGYGVSDPADTWPAVLERLLAAQGATVGNFGVSGSTLLKAGDNPYWDTWRFAPASASTPTRVLIMLGTNDSKSFNWNAHGGDFAADLTAMITHFRDLPSRPSVVVMTPPAIYANSFDISETIVVGSEIPVITSVAAALAVPVIDVHAATAGHPAWFPDGVHPNADGMAAIAATVAGRLAEIDASNPGGGTGGDSGTGSDPGNGGGTGSGGSSSGADRGSEAGGHRGCGIGSGFTLLLGSVALGLGRRRRVGVAIR